MKKTIIILVVVLLLAVAGFFGFRAMQKSPAGSESQINATAKTDKAGVVDKLKEAVTGENTLQCDSVVASSDGTKTYMTTYYRLGEADMKMRSETIIGKGTPAESKLISVMTGGKDDVVSYSWSVPTGPSPALKMDLNSECMQSLMNNPAFKEQIEKSKKDQETAMDANKTLAQRMADLKFSMEKVAGTTCQYNDAAVDTTLPAGTKFTDMCEMLGGLSEMMKKIGQ